MHRPGHRRRGGPENGLRLPLAALRPVLDEGSRNARWLLHPDGVLGRALCMSAGPPYTLALSLSRPVRFTARAMLLPHDWRDGNGTVHAAVTATQRSGAERELWRGQLRTSRRGPARGLPVSCTIPADTVALKLRLSVTVPLRPGSTTRAIWLEPALHDEEADPQPAAESPSSRDSVRAASPTETSPAAVGSRGGPLISVLVPVHDPPPTMLQDAIESVLTQSFTDWELILLDDGSRDPRVLSVLEQARARDPRVQVRRHDQAQGISGATNGALAAASGEYVALLDHDDTLTADALALVAECVRREPELDMIYSDEAVIDDDGRHELHIKPGWSPDHFATAMYTCHLAVYRRELARELGGFRSRFDGCQDYDFALRVMDRTDRIEHIPRILYHWRAHERSTAGGEAAKPYAYLAQRGAIADHLHRAGIDASVQYGRFPGLHRIVHRVPTFVTVDLLLAVTRLDGLEDAVRSWVAQPHETWRARIAAPEALHAAIRSVWDRAGADAARLTLIDNPPASTPARGLRDAAADATADHLVLMQMPTIGLTRDWLTRLLGYSGQPGIGAAGPVVLARDGRIMQDGIALPEGVPLHLHHGDDPGAAHLVVYNVLAVSGVLATPRARFQRAGGLRTELGELALIEYCLRCDGRVVVVPDSRLRNVGSDAVVNDLDAILELRRIWAGRLGRDPYYNRAYRTDRGDLVPSG